MGPVEPNNALTQQQPQSQKLKRRSHSNEGNSRENNRQKSRRNSRSRSGDRESSSSSSSSFSSDDHDRNGGNGSMDEENDDDANASDRSSQGSSSMRMTDTIRWDYRMNLIGKPVKDSKTSCCLQCRYPILLVGRLVPCKHSAFCLQCANEYKTARRNCPRCNEPITDVEKIEAKKLILCRHDSHPCSHDICLRGYTSQRDLEAHIKRRHEQPLLPQSNQTRLDSPHQLHPPTHQPTPAFPGLVVDPQQQPSVPPPIPSLLPFPPINVSGIAPPPPPPHFDMPFRPPGYGLPPQQQFIPPQQQFMPPQPQYRSQPYPPNRTYH